MSKDIELYHELSASPLSEPLAELEIIKRWEGDIETPLVSIICHAYQHADYIKDALNGFLSQKTTFPFEIIVRDDASTDETAAIITEYATRYPSIIKPVLETENQYVKGVNLHIITTFPMARGKYIAFCEGDDYWCDPEKLQIQINYLKKNDDCVITYHNTIVVDDQRNILDSESDGSYKDYSQYMLLRGARMPNLTRCFRNVVQEFPIEFGYSPAGDVFLTTLLGKYGSAKCLPNIKPAAYRRHDGGIWAGVSENKRRIDLAVSFYWIAVYFNRIGMAKVSRANTLSAIMIIISQLPLGVISTFKLFINKIFMR